MTEQPFELRVRAAYDAFASEAVVEVDSVAVAALVTRTNPRPRFALARIRLGASELGGGGACGPLDPWTVGDGDRRQHAPRPSAGFPGRDQRGTEYVCGARSACRSRSRRRQGRDRRWPARRIN